MNLRSIPRSAVSGYIKLLRAPIDIGLRLAGRGSGGAELAVDRADATARQVAGRMTGDEKLRRDGSKRGAATSERRRAQRLRAKAQERTAEADRRLAETEEQAAERRQRSRKQAQARKQRADERRQQAAEQAAEKELRGLE